MRLAHFFQRGSGVPRKILLLLFFLASTFIAWELILYSLPIGVLKIDRDVWWKYLPTFGSQVNRMGYRGPVYPPGKSDGLRIITFGCSSTFGFGYTDANSYPRILESTLKKELRSKPVEVINAGVSGYSTHQGLILLKKMIPIYHPDVVTFMFGNNDGYYSRTKLSDNRRKYPELNGLQRFFKKIPSAVAQTYLFVSLHWGDKNLEQVVRVSPDQFTANMAEAYRFCNEHQCRLILLTYPTQKAEHRNKVYNDRVRMFARQYQIPLVDDAKQLRPLGDEAYFMDKNHPGKLGHRMIGQWLAETIKEQLEAKSAE